MKVSCQETPSSNPTMAESLKNTYVVTIAAAAVVLHTPQHICCDHSTTAYNEYYNRQTESPTFHLLKNKNSHMIHARDGRAIFVEKGPQKHHHHHQVRTT